MRYITLRVATKDNIFDFRSNGTIEDYYPQVSIRDGNKIIRYSKYVAVQNDIYYTDDTGIVFTEASYSSDKYTHMHIPETHGCYNLCKIYDSVYTKNIIFSLDILRAGHIKHQLLTIIANLYTDIMKRKEAKSPT